MRILLIDDHALYRDGILLMLEGLPMPVESFEAGSYESAKIIMDKNNDLDMVLLDLDLPGINFIEALLAIRQQLPNASIVILSGTEDPEIVEQTLSLGARGYFPKSLPAKQMLNALQLIIAGDTYMPASILQNSNIRKTARDITGADLNTSAGVFDKEGKCAGVNKSENNLAHKLTARQYEVLTQLAKGKSNKAIGNTLFITESTVRVHVASILKSFGVSNRTQAVRYAVQNGWATVNDST